MGSDRGHKKFSFPIPRRSHAKVEEILKDDDDVRSTRSARSTAPAPEWTSHHDESSSKAHRVLGTSNTLYRSTSGQTSVPPSPGYVSISVSEASSTSRIDSRMLTTAADKGGHQKRPGMTKRPSSNVLGRPYTGDGRRGSDHSSFTNRLRPQNSNSTLRSHYDAKNSPLCVSQQTSDSAVRDGALRRGQPPVLQYNGQEASPISPGMLDETSKKESRKGRPARLDLSRLFPKPKGVDGQLFEKALLSPTKMVNSPIPLSATSDHFPRPMTREATPLSRANIKSDKSPRYHRSAVESPPSPIRRLTRDEYDNAKMNVRRPPKGAQHWFDALDEDSDESVEARQQVPAPKPFRQNKPAPPLRSSVDSHRSRERVAPQSESRLRDPTPSYRKDTFSLEDIVDISHMTSPSQVSLSTHYSKASTRTKESALSKKNLQDSSVLSFSSSEDEAEGEHASTRRVPVRKSLDTGDYTGDIIIGQAQAYEVRPHHRKPSTGRLSTTSTSTSAATIEVMYTPEPPFPSFQYPRNSNYSSGRSSTFSGSRRSSHIRQPSVIHEHEDSRPRTAINKPQSPSTQSVVSARTTASAPQPPSSGSHKLMHVTAEEEALLELMRKKRAAMNQQCEQQGNKAALASDKRQETLRRESRPPRRTSGFLSMSLETSPIRGEKARASQQVPTTSSSPRSQPRGRSARASGESNVAMSHLRDSSASDPWSERHNSHASRGSLPHYLPTPSEFSPLEPFPPSSPTPAASVASPTTTDHPSPIPSPITPGASLSGRDVAVKVANSDTSNDVDDISVLEHGGIITAPSKSTRPDSTHQRRRTASSDAEITFPAPPSSTKLRELPSVSEASSRPSSVAEPIAPKPQRKITRHISELALSASYNKPRSRQSSVHSTASRTSAYSQASSYLTDADRNKSRRLKSDDGTTSDRKGMPEERDSISNDVLAAWNSLGGTY